MPNTATKRDKKHSKAGRSPSVPTTTTKGKINTPERAEAPKSRKTNNPKPQPLKGGRRTPQGGQKSQSAKKLTPITTTKTNGDSPGPRTPIKKTPTPTAKPETPQAGQKPQGAQKGNTSSSNQQQRTIASHSHQEEERHNRGAKHPNKKQNTSTWAEVPERQKTNTDHKPQPLREEDEHPRAGRSPTAPKKQTPTSTNNRNRDSAGRRKSQSATHQPTEKEGRKEERKERKKKMKERKRRRIKNCTAWQQKTQSDLTPRADKPQSAKHNTKHQHKPQSG